MTLREMTLNDAAAVLEIYQKGLLTENATFETHVPTWQEWDGKYQQHSRWVCETQQKIMGWAALTPVSTRQVYKGVAEVSIYVDTHYLQKGIGTLLMEKLIQSSEENGIWTLFSSVFPENTATLKLHQKFDFRRVGYREKIAQLNGKWRDTILLERRSKKIGIS